MRKRKIIRLSITFILLLAVFSIKSPAQRSLKAAFAGYFMIGAAINQSQIYEEDTRGVSVIRNQFNTISPENVLKWDAVHPLPDRFYFEASDRYVSFGEKYGMFTVGHTLVWHNQMPDWVFKDRKGNLVGRDELLRRLHEHIRTVVGRYKGKIKGWDVVNEALNDDGTLRRSPWLKIIGEDYIGKAFQFAHEADPGAELYYNDFSLENETKLKGAIKLVKRLQAARVPISAVGIQGHDNLTFPTPAQQERAISELARLGIKVNISELDISVIPDPEGFAGAEVTLDFQMKEELDPYRSGLPDVVQQQLAKRYGELFGIFVKHRKEIGRVTFWNVTDGDSWLNNFPVRGRTNYPLLFDRSGRTKPAYDSVIQTVN
jgi:endo-1,4-beta-xylanase